MKNAQSKTSEGSSKRPFKFLHDAFKEGIRLRSKSWDGRKNAAQNRKENRAKYKNGEYE